MKKMKRVTACILALALLLGLTGCGAQEQSQQPTAAKGRYVEQEMELPVTGYPRDMVRLTTGQLRLALVVQDQEAVILTSNADGTGWEQPQTLPKVITDGGYLEKVALSAQGDIFCSGIYAQEDGTFQYRFWAADSSMKAREIPVTYPDVNPAAGYLLTDAVYDQNGQLYVVIGFNHMMTLNTETGELGPELNPQGDMLMSLSMAGNGCYGLGHQNLYELKNDAMTLAEDSAFTRQIIASLKATEGTTPRVRMWQKDDYLFFTTPDGLYSYLPGGSVTEELVAGNRSSLGDPTFSSVAMTGGDDKDFYVLGMYNGGEPALYHYRYDPEAPTQPSTTLRVYSLYEDSDLRQMISQYQKSNPDVAIDLEVGLSGEDGTTEADAIRTLNTQILAGDGPDIIQLDGMNLDTYLEKGLLEDLSDVLAAGDKLVEPVTRCYGEGGKVFAVPTTFALPTIYGPKHIVSQIRDLDSLVAAVNQAKEENTIAMTVLNGILPELVADLFYDSCSAAWVKADGTLDEGELTRYYSAMKQVYDVDQDYRTQNEEMLKQWMAEGGDDLYTPGDYTGLSGAMMVLMQAMYLNVGTLEGMDHWSMVLAGDDQLDDFAVAPLSLQEEGIFLPRRIMGVLNTGKNIQAAKDFVAYMLSDDVQAKSLSSGFPVNRVTLDREIAEDRKSTATFGTSDAQGNMLELDGQYPDAARRQQLGSWVDDLTTPALTNRIIRSMVIDQAADCMEGKTTPEEAAKAAIKALNLYLSE